MQEIELKCQIPAGALEALRAELRALPGGERAPQRLQAAYFDTPDRKLARARAALRVRQEDDDWVQTLKAAGANAMTRLEDNQPVPAFAPGEAIVPDLSRHVDAAVHAALVRDLGWQPEVDPQGTRTGLLLLYRTDMRRLRATLDTSSAAASRGWAAPADPARAGQVEIALDLGEIAAGGQRRAVRELEVELTGGDARAVIEVTRDFVRRHGLWLDTQTKAHRGDQLAREAESGRPSPLPPARPRARVKPGMQADRAWLAGVDAALDQIGACLSEVALHDGSQALDVTPWIRGWATGLRRLAWLWRHAPSPSHAVQRDDGQQAAGALAQAIAAQRAMLCPKPGQWLDAASASAFARAAAPSLLALDVLEVVITAQSRAQA